MSRHCRAMDAGSPWNSDICGPYFEVPWFGTLLGFMHTIFYLGVFHDSRQLGLPALPFCAPESHVW